MTINELQSALRNLEGKISVARDHAKFHRDRADAYDRDVLKYETAIDALREVMGGTTGTILPIDPIVAALGAPAPVEVDTSHRLTAADVFDDGVEEARTVSQRSFHGRRPGPAPAGANGFDRDAVKRELQAHHIYYPVAKSYRTFVPFFRQYLVSRCTTNPGYKAYLAGGGRSLTERIRTRVMIHEAVILLGVDAQRARDEAKILHDMIYRNGVEGVDYL